MMPVRMTGNAGSRSQSLRGATRLIPDGGGGGGGGGRGGISHLISVKIKFPNN